MSGNSGQHSEGTSDLKVSGGNLRCPAIGLDLDGTIDEAPAFFAALTQSWPGRIVIITYRDDRSKALDDLARYGVRFDELVLVSSFAEKAVVLREKKIGVYIDDQDEILMHVPEGVVVLKIRNGGNYHYNTSKWLYSARTGEQL